MTEQFEFTSTENAVHPTPDTSVFGEDVRADARRMVELISFPYFCVSIFE